jgi:hypothetical protein
MSAQPARNGPWGWILAILGLLFFISLVNGHGPSTSTGGTTSNSDHSPSGAKTFASGNYAGSGVAAVDRTLLPSERENYARDPSGQGFSEEDRAFLEEHGVSESEARAAETILREQGVD